ncbi:hypothetical protein CR513_00879, partial [Mucuna pruriens]
MLKDEYEVSFKENYCFIMDEHEINMTKIEMIRNNFHLKFDLVEGHGPINESNVWYGRFGHTNLKSLKLIQNTGGVDLINYNDNDIYYEIDVQFVEIVTKALPKSSLEFFNLKFGTFIANLKEECSQ